MADETTPAAGPIRPEPKNPPAPKTPERPPVAAPAPTPAPVVASLDDIARVVVAAQRAATLASSAAAGKTVGLDETVEGGRYEVNGVLVDAHGKVLPRD